MIDKRREGLGDYALPPSGLNPYGSQAKPAAAIARGHRGYLDPNPRLIRWRTSVSHTEAARNHRSFSHPIRPQLAEEQ